MCFKNHDIVTSLKVKLKTGNCVKSSHVYKLYNMTSCKRLVNQGPRFVWLRTLNMLCREADTSHQQHWFHSQNILCCLFSVCSEWNICGGICLKKTIFSELWFPQILKFFYASLFKRLELLPLQFKYMFSLTNSL